MFYNNEQFFEEIDEYLDDISAIEKKLVIDARYRGRIESDLRISLIIKTTGVLENLFYDICKEFSIMHSSPIFHKYFAERFKKEGKNANPELINNLLKIFGIRLIKKEDSPAAYESLSSLYNIRNENAHGNLNFTESIEEIKEYIINSKVFFRLVIERFDEYSNQHPLEIHK